MMIKSILKDKNVEPVSILKLRFYQAFVNLVDPQISVVHEIMDNREWVWTNCSALNEDGEEGGFPLCANEVGVDIVQRVGGNIHHTILRSILNRKHTSHLKFIPLQWGEHL